MEQGRTKELFTLGENFIGGWSIIRMRLVIERRYLRQWRSDSLSGGGGGGGGRGSERRERSACK